MPLSLVKVRSQTQGSHVGKQYSYRGIWHGLNSIYQQEGGLKGLFAGSWASQLRVGIGSATQLASYKRARSICETHLGISNEMLLTLASSSLGGVATSLAMNPLDVASTRLYNHAAKYRGLSDCLAQTVRSEGVLALWKGLSGQYARIVPHSILMMVIAESLGFDFGK